MFKWNMHQNNHFNNNQSYLSIISTKLFIHIKRDNVNKPVDYIFLFYQYLQNSFLYSVFFLLVKVLLLKN